MLLNLTERTKIAWPTSELKEKLGEITSRISLKFRSLNWHNRALYADYLAQSYFYVRYSTPLLALAAGNMDPELHRGFFRRYIKHIGEENAHDLMALRDLQKLGCKIEDFPERAQTRMFWETQFYKIEHISPLAFMGYILLLEAVAVVDCKFVSDKVHALYGEANTFLRVHAEDDPSHLDEALKVYESLETEMKAYVVQNMIQTGVCFEMILDALAADHPVQH